MKILVIKGGTATEVTISELVEAMQPILLEKFATVASLEQGLLEKSDKNHRHKVEEITLDTYTKGQIDEKLKGKANREHWHDAEYYKKGDMNKLLAEKADREHVHSEYVHTRKLDESLAAKAGQTHVHEIHHITGLTEFINKKIDENNGN